MTVDGGLLTIDGGLLTIDGGLLTVNGGLLTVDGGLLTVDGGLLTVDGGLLTVDGGLLTVDGGLLTVDGGVRVLIEHVVLLVVALCRAGGRSRHLAARLGVEDTAGWGAVVADRGLDDARHRGVGRIHVGHHLRLRTTRDPAADREILTWFTGHPAKGRRNTDTVHWAPCKGAETY